MTAEGAGDAPRALAVLGIGAAEEQVYRHLIAHPGARMREIAHALSLSDRRTLRLLDTIESLGLARHSPEQPRRYHAAAPDMAVEALILKQQEDLQRARVAAQVLQEQATAARRTGRPEQLVELIASSEAERLVYEQMHLGAQDELVTMMRPPMRVSRLEAPYDHTLEVQANARGVRLRTVVDGDYLAMPGAIDYLRSEMAVGIQARVVPTLPFKMVVTDRRMAIIPLQPERADSPVLLVRSSALLDALYVLFEMLWQRGSPVLFGAVPSGADTGPEPAEQRQLLALMAAGLNDKAIAHELGMSARTFERRVAALLGSIGARTRFQAGYLAALRELPVTARPQATPPRTRPDAPSRRPAVGRHGELPP